MKKIVSVLMSVLVVLFSCTIVSNANYLDVFTKYNSDFDFLIHEYENDNNTTRIFYNEDIGIGNRNQLLAKNEFIVDSDMSESFLKTKAVLYELGMEESLINNLDQNQLLRYTIAESITVTVSYIREDEDGNLTYVTEEEAIEHADNYSNRDESSVSPMQSDTSEDSYMRMTLTGSYWGGGVYSFALDAQWLKMPNYRTTDSLGICVDDHSVVWETRRGTISYNRVNSIKGTDVFETEGLLPSAFRLAEQNTWTGVAVLFNLKNDYIFGDHFYNYTAHMEFETMVSQHEQPLNFNVLGVYHHSEGTNISIDSASIGIDFSGTFGISIGITTNSAYTRREVFSARPYQYVPD